MPCTPTAAIHNLNQPLHQWTRPLCSSGASTPLRRAAGKGAEGTALGASRSPARPPRTPHSTCPAAEPGRALLTPEPAGRRARAHPVGAQTALRCPEQMHLCDSLFFHGLELKDVHGLCVAGGGQEHAVRAEGQRADAHTPRVRGRPESHCLLGTEGSQQRPRDFTEVTAKEGPRDRRMWGYWYLPYSLLVTPSKHVLKEGECLKDDTKYESPFNRSLRG